MADGLGGGCSCDDGLTFGYINFINKVLFDLKTAKVNQTLFLLRIILLFFSD